MSLREKKRTGRLTAPGEGLIVLPPDPGRKSAHIALITHRGGGWYQVECFGTAKKCKAGECKHTADMAIKRGRRQRPVKQIPRAVAAVTETDTTNQENQIP